MVDTTAPSMNYFSQCTIPNGQCAMYTTAVQHPYCTSTVVCGDNSHTSARDGSICQPYFAQLAIPILPSYQAVKFHYCSVCKRFRSGRFHRENPLVPGCVPIPGVCRNCRVKEVSEEKDNCEQLNEDEARDWHPHPPPVENSRTVKSVPPPLDQSPSVSPTSERFPFTVRIRLRDVVAQRHETSSDDKTQRRLAAERSIAAHPRAWRHGETSWSDNEQEKYPPKAPSPQPEQIHPPTGHVPDLTQAAAQSAESRKHIPYSREAGPSPKGDTVPEPPEYYYRRTTLRPISPQVHPSRERRHDNVPPAHKSRRARYPSSDSSQTPPSNIRSGRESVSRPSPKAHRHNQSGSDSPSSHQKRKVAPSAVRTGFVSNALRSPIRSILNPHRYRRSRSTESSDSGVREWQRAHPRQRNHSSSPSPPPRSRRPPADPRNERLTNRVSFASTSHSAPQAVKEYREAVKDAIEAGRDERKFRKEKRDVRLAARQCDDFT